MYQEQYFKSLKFKIAAGFAAIFLTISFLLNLLLYNNLSESLELAFQKNILLEANGILLLLGEDYSQIPITDVDQPFQIWLGRSGSAEKVYERADFPKDYSGLLQAAIDQFYQGSNKYEFTLESDSLSFGLVRNASFETVGSDLIMVLSKNNLQHKEQLSSLRSLTILNTLCACLISLIISLFFAHTTLKPINHLIDKAKSIKPSTQMNRLPVSKSGDELGKLSETFNQMIGRIEEGIQNQSRFFNSAAHELRTPLANMQAELALELNNFKGQNAESTIISIQQEVTRMQLIVSDFLILAQVEAETISLRKEKVSLDDLIYDMIEKTKYMRDNHGSTLKVNINSSVESFFFQADLPKMESLISNLLINAFKHGDNSEIVRVEIGEMDSSLSFSIINKVMPEGKKTNGNGLGLWLCRKIAEIHGFDFRTKEITGHFHAVLEIPSNARNSPH